MNKGTQGENTRNLIAYELAAQQEQQLTDTGERRKLTLNLKHHYHDVLERMALLQGKTKTAVVRQALDVLATQFGDELLYPKVELELVSEE
jgi:hypothetical protein|tara:strand:+ start:82 stop:354 length:273 start_codon:yes stop_codon:yes gene_type:complete